MCSSENVKMTLNQNGFENCMEVFKTQLQIATAIFYRMPLIDQINAIQLLKEIVKDLQEALSEIQHSIEDQANNEVKTSVPLYSVADITIPSSKTNTMLQWKLSYNENNDITQLLEDHHCQNCFSIPLTQGNCSLAQENDDQHSIIEKEDAVQLKIDSETSSNIVCNTKETCHLINADKISLIQNNSNEDSTILLKNAYDKDHLEIMNDEAPVNDSYEKFPENNLIDEIIRDRTCEDVVQNEKDLETSFDDIPIDATNKELKEAIVKNISKSAENQNSEIHLNSSESFNIEELEMCNRKTFKTSSNIKKDNFHLRKRKNKFEQLVGTRCSQRLATKRQKIKQLSSLNKNSQKQSLSLSVKNSRNSETRENISHQVSTISMSNASNKNKKKGKQMSLEKLTDLVKTKQIESHELTKSQSPNPNGLVLETLSVSCRQCRIEFSDVANFYQHICKGSAEFYCDKCHIKFSHPQHFHKHMNGHNRNNCKICNAQFAKRKALCKHLKYTHKILEAEKLYECTYCERKFIKRPSLYVHLKEHAGDKIVCLKCGLMCDKEQYEKHMLKHSEEAKFHCIKCNECFFRRQQFEQHMLGHDKYDCNICNLSFSTKKHLLKHQRVVHCVYSHEDKKHECPICKKKFQRPMLLEIHMRLHTGERPIQCVHCEKNFRTPKALAKHLKTSAHLKASGQSTSQSSDIEKSFLCAECGAKFYRKQGLIRHTQQLHSNERPYVCPYCEYSCKCKTNLKRHIELHTNERKFICELCGASFHARATLKEHHAYVHSEARNFICSDCGKGFKGRSGLRRHVRIHSDARPYICFCGQSYKRMSHLKRHMISIHGSTFKSKRVTRLPDENSQPTNTDSFSSKQSAENSLDEVKQTGPDPEVNKLKLIDQDKIIAADKGNVSYKVQNAVIEMLQNISIEHLESSSDSNNILSENSSLQQLLTLTSNHGTSSSNTLHLIQSSALECASDLQFTFSSSTSSSEEASSSHCILNSETSLQQSASPSNGKYLICSNINEPMMPAESSSSMLASSILAQNPLEPTQLFSSLNCSNCSVPANSEGQNDISLKCNSECYVKNTGSDGVSKIDDSESSVPINTTSDMSVLTSSTEIEDMLTLSTPETNSLSVSDTNNILVQSVNSLNFNHTKY